MTSAPLWIRNLVERPFIAIGIIRGPSPLQTIMDMFGGEVSPLNLGTVVLQVHQRDRGLLIITKVVNFFSLSYWFTYCTSIVWTVITIVQLIIANITMY